MSVKAEVNLGMPVDPTSDRPLYKQIADHLRTSIKAGEYTRRLPGEGTLAATFGVTKMTARQAVEVLKAEGLVRAERGRGVFIQETPTVRRLSRSRQSTRFRETGKGAYDAEIRALGLEPTVELAEIGPIVCPEPIVPLLGLRRGQRVLIRRRRMYADGQPMQLATSYVPWSLARGTRMTEPDTGPGGLYSRLAEAGHKPEQFTEEVATRLATTDEARFLGVSQPAPVFFIIRTAVNGNGMPVEVCEHIMAGDRWRLFYEWPAD
jgi:GntR family transcriptional regulator